MLSLINLVGFLAFTSNVGLIEAVPLVQEARFTSEIRYPRESKVISFSAGESSRPVSIFSEASLNKKSPSPLRKAKDRRMSEFDSSSSFTKNENLLKSQEEHVSWPAPSMEEELEETAEQIKSLIISTETNKKKATGKASTRKKPWWWSFFKKSRSTPPSKKFQLDLGSDKKMKKSKSVPAPQNADPQNFARSYGLFYGPKSAQRSNSIEGSGSKILLPVGNAQGKNPRIPATARIISENRKIALREAEMVQAMRASHSGKPAVAGPKGLQISPASNPEPIGTDEFAFWPKDQSDPFSGHHHKESSKPNSPEKPKSQGDESGSEAASQDEEDNVSLKDWIAENENSE